MKKKFKYIFSSLMIAFGVSLSSAIGVSLANYQAVSKVTQLTGYQGKLNQASIFFNANIWEVDNALFYLYNNTTGKWIAPTRTITPTIGGTNFNLYVYVLQDPAKTSSIVFARINPNGRSIPVDGENTAWDFASGDGKTVWNQTDNFTYSASYNYYCIPSGGWTSGTYTHNSGEANSSCNKNNLTLSGSTLSFDGSDSAVSSIAPS